MSTLDDYTIADARSHGFGLLELYKLWHWNNCFPQAYFSGEIDKMTRAAQRELDERYQLLPLDAEGEVIHVGDDMVAADGQTFTVGGVGLDNGHGVVYYTTEDGCDGYVASTCHHYRKPTVEELLRRFGPIYGATNVDDIDSLVSKYAKRIRELGDD